MLGPEEGWWFVQDFAKAFSTLLELGVPFKEELPKAA